MKRAQMYEFTAESAQEKKKWEDNIENAMKGKCKREREREGERESERIEREKSEGIDIGAYELEEESKMECV